MLTFLDSILTDHTEKSVENQLPPPVKTPVSLGGNPQLSIDAPGKSLLWTNMRSKKLKSRSTY